MAYYRAQCLKHVRHLNNSRYLALMDLGRYHFLLVSGLWRLVLREGWAPVLVGAEISFRRSLRPGERFVLETRQGDIGNKSVRLIQRFWVGEELAAEASVTALFLKGGRSQPLAPLLARFPHLSVAGMPDHAEATDATPSLATAPPDGNLASS